MDGCPVLSTLSYSTLFNMSVFLNSAGLRIIKERILRYCVVFHYILAQQPPVGLVHPIHEVSVSHTTTHPSRYDSLGPDNTQHLQQTNIPGEIRTHNLSRQVPTDLLLRPRGHWDYVVFGCQKQGLLSRAISLTGGFCNQNGGCLLHSTNRTVNTIQLKWLICSYFGTQ
jgi:hypothetical protein